MHGEQKYAQSSEIKKTGSVYRIVKSSTIYTASFKTQMFSTIPTNHINVTSSAVRWRKKKI